MTLNAFGMALLRTGLTPEQAKGPNLEPQPKTKKQARDATVYAEKCRDSAARRVAILEAQVARLEPRTECGDRAEANIPMHRRAAALEADVTRAERYRAAARILTNARARLAYWTEKAGG